MIDLPPLVGFSRKSMITKALETKEFALNGTSILNTIFNEGANILEFMMWRKQRMYKFV